MSLELRADRISGGEGHFHEIFVDGSPFAGASAVDTSNFVTTGHTGDFVSSWETGNFVSKWETGDHATNIGDLSDVETSSAGHTPDGGEVLTWDDGMSHWMPKSLETGDFVSNWQTGDFVSKWETGDNVGNTETR